MLHNLPTAIILPFGNNEKNLEKAANKIIRVLKNLIKANLISEASYLLLIDNGSTDNSWYLAGKLVAINPRLVHAIKLQYPVKSTAIMKNASYCINILVNFDNYDNIEKYILNNKTSIIIDKNHSLKDFFKSSKYIVTDELP